MKIIVKDFENESTDMVYPCLLEHIPDHLNPTASLDIVLATGSNGDFIRGIVLTNNNQLDGFSVGSFVELYLLKRHYRPFHGEVVLSNG